MSQSLAVGGAVASPAADARVQPALPDPRTLRCSELIEGTQLPEFDRFGLFTIDGAIERVGKNLARLLAEISLSALSEASK